MICRMWDSKLLRSEMLLARKGVRYTSALFAIKIIPANRVRTGVLIVASKKRVHKQAVLRNRAKRRIRAALDCVKFEVPTLSIITINQDSLHAKFGALTSELQNKYTTFYRALNRANSAQSTNCK